MTHVAWLIPSPSGKSELCNNGREKGILQRVFHVGKDLDVCAPNSFYPSLLHLDVIFPLRLQEMQWRPVCYLMKSYSNIHWYWCVNALYSMMLVARRLIGYFHCFLFLCCNAKNCRLCSVRFLCCLLCWKYQLTPVWLSVLFTSWTNNAAARPAGSFCWNWLTSSHWLSFLRT